MLLTGIKRTGKIQDSEAQVEQKVAELQDTEQQALMEMVKADAAAAQEERIRSLTEWRSVRLRMLTNARHHESG